MHDHDFIDLAAIAKGLLNYLALAKTKKVWGSVYGGWMRATRIDIAPNVAVRSEALKAYSENIRNKKDPLSFKKFLSEN